MRFTRVVVGLLVLPHEAAHAVVAALAGLDPEVTVLPDWDGSAEPLGQFDADIPPETSTWVIRLIAVAPLVIYLGVAAVVGAVSRSTSLSSLAAALVIGFWASLSDGDIAVAANPHAARDAGRLLVPPSRWSRFSPLVTVGTVLAVAGLVFV
ncbi:MAG: hypothetical protein ABEH80_07230 [Halobaculum sp.]|jgi:hypothetical protein